MKKSILLAIGLCVFTATLSFAQSPAKFNYQAVARDATGGILANQAVGVKSQSFQGRQLALLFTQKRTRPPQPALVCLTSKLVLAQVLPVVFHLLIGPLTTTSLK